VTSANNNFNTCRRQPWISEISYKNTLVRFDEDYQIMQSKLQESAGDPFERSLDLRVIATHLWFAFQLKYTAGVELSELAEELSKVVLAYEEYSDEVENIPEDKYFSPFPLNDVIDEYVDYLNLLSACVLLHREDLVPRVHNLIVGTEFDENDAVIEEILKFFLQDRPALDNWTWENPYRLLLDAIDEVDEQTQSKSMGSYVKNWYSGLRRQAHFWGKHEQISDDFSPYSGYWAMCAAAFTYLYEIDDSAYRDELVYPKDMVDFARSMPRNPALMKNGVEVLRVLGGRTCPREGVWFSPAMSNSSKYFKVGEVMPTFSESEYGTTIWQWGLANNV
jgi:hypothetical protein